MNSFRWSPVFQMFPRDVSTPTPAAITSVVYTPVNDLTGSMVAGTHVYTIVGARTGSIAIWTLTAITHTVSVGSGQAVRIRLPQTTGVNAWFIWHRGPDTAGQDRFNGWTCDRPDGAGFVYYTDYAGGGISGALNPAIPTASWLFHSTIKLSNYDSAGAPRATSYQNVMISNPKYPDLCDEVDRVNENKEIVRRERGVRRGVEMRYECHAQSNLSRILPVIYGAKLAYPLVKMFFALNADASNPTWREVSIEGDYDPSPVGGKHLFIKGSWMIKELKASMTVPPIVFPTYDGTQIW